MLIELIKVYVGTPRKRRDEVFANGGLIRGRQEREDRLGAVVDRTLPAWPNLF
jgi:hypothetical protein